MVASIAAAPSDEGAAAGDGELAQEHRNDPGLLIDLTKCVGCGACVDACKAKNDLATRADQPATGFDAEFASSNWSIVKAERVPGAKGGIRTVKKQCMHCLEPACASVCFVKALRKSAAGPVTYDPSKCVGCRFCLMACPFGIPSFDWDSRFGRVEKCNLCMDRTSKGLPTACAEACPTGAVTFGRRGDLLKTAWGRISSEPDKYVSHVYGEREVGGTSVLYISDIPFEDLGFLNGLPAGPLPQYAWEITRLIPPAAAGVGAGLIALYLRRRKLLLEREGAESQEESA